MKLSQIVEPTPEIIQELKKSYNRLLKRHDEAKKYLDNNSIPLQEREKYLLHFQIEILDPLNAYKQVLDDWGINIGNILQVSDGKE